MKYLRYIQMSQIGKRKSQLTNNDVRTDDRQPISMFKCILPTGNWKAYSIQYMYVYRRVYECTLIAYLHIAKIEWLKTSEKIN